MVNPVVLYVPPALPVLPTGSTSTAVVPYQPPSNTDPFAIGDAVNVQIISGTPARPGAAGGRWPASGGSGPGWWNDATPSAAAGAYASAVRMSAGAPNGQLMDLSV
jgi:hypothetical protein